MTKYNWAIVPSEVEYFITPYDFYGVKMWAIEDMNGYTFKYCNSKKDAEDYIGNFRESLEKRPVVDKKLEGE